jgi:hypothetical protein
VIHRDLAAELERAATWAPSITLTGPRQSGKTTLCQAVFPDHPYRSLESPDDRAFAQDDPRAFLAQFPRGAVLDEVQRVPDLLSYLQGIIDADPTPGRWILSGSQNFALLESVTQSLAGRTAMHRLLPLSWDESRRFPRGPASLDEALFCGGYPHIINRSLNPADWLRSYVATYIERDVRTITSVGNLTTFQRFVELCAGRTAQLLNYSSLADDCGISQPTAKAWFSILEASFIAFHLPPFSVKQRKRLVKMPKLYFHDVGLACWLLGIRESAQLRSHPLRGALFETWVVSEVLKHRTHRGRSGGLSFYRDRHGAELDLVVEESDDLTLIEAKSAATPSSALLAGLKRIRPHLQGLRPGCDAAAVYGGEESQQRTPGRLIPWRLVRSAAPPEVEPLVQVFVDGRPVADAGVLAVFPDRKWKSAKTDERGRATLELSPRHLPLTVFVAKDGFAAHEEPAWIPDERALHVYLQARPGTGAGIFEGVEPGSEVPVVLNGKAVTIDLVEGTHRVLKLDPAEGPDPTELGWSFPRRFLVRVVRVFDGAALLAYGPADDQATVDA